jgi:hypothetical protein
VLAYERVREKVMTRSYTITESAQFGVSHIRYTEREVRCLSALFWLCGRRHSFREWLRFRWLLLVSSERVIRHLEVCAFRQQRMAQRRQERIARLAAFRS